MKTSRRFAILLLSTASVAVLALGLTAVNGGDDAIAKSVAHVKDVMITNNGEGGVKDQVGEAIKKGGFTDEDWEAIEARAAMLAEGGNLLLALKPPRGADTPEGLAAWKKRVVEYRGCAEAIHDAAEKKDAAAATTAFASMMKRCAECHKEHKPKD